MIMKNKTSRPITDLRNTNEISKQCHELNEPLHITKNGYDDLVIMSSDTFNSMQKEKRNSNEIPIQSKCYGMIKVACATNDIKVSCVRENFNSIVKIIEDSKSLDLGLLIIILSIF